MKGAFPGLATVRRAGQAMSRMAEAEVKPFVKVQAATRWSVPTGSVGGEHVAMSEDFTGLIWHGIGESISPPDNPFSNKLNLWP